MNYNEIIKRLHEPFSAKEIEWKIQVKPVEQVYDF